MLGFNKEDDRTIVLKDGETPLAFNKQNGSMDNYSYKNKRLPASVFNPISGVRRPITTSAIICLNL
jgi:hypothetical protein